MRILEFAAKVVIGLVVLFIVIVVMGGLAGAQTLSCAPVDQVVEVLANQYGEELVGDGVAPNGARLLVFARPDGASWTVLGLLPDGKACPVAAGTQWTSHERTKPGSET
jgi:hypothetical protein